MKQHEIDLADKVAELLSKGIHFNVLPIAQGIFEPGYNPTNPKLTRHPKVLYSISKEDKVLLTLDEHMQAAFQVEDETYQGMTDAYVQPVVDDILAALEYIPGKNIVFAAMDSGTIGLSSNVAVSVESSYDMDRELTTFKIDLLFAVFS